MNQRLGGTYHFHLQGRKLAEQGSSDYTSDYTDSLVYIWAVGSYMAEDGNFQNNFTNYALDLAPQ
jgi:hypothetical protein